MSQAVRDLGPASVLAHQLKLAEGRKLPHWWTAVIAIVITIWAWGGMVIATANALTDAAVQLGGTHTVTVHAAWLGTTVTVTHGQHLLSGAFHQSSNPAVLALIAIPLVAARAWRYRPAWLQQRLASRAIPKPAPRRGS